VGGYPLQNGFRVIGAFDGLNDVDNIAGSLSRAKQRGAYTFGSLSFCESPLHTDEHYVKTTEDLIKRADVDAIMIKDAGGLLTVDRIRTLVPKLKKAMGNRLLELHSHCLTGLAPLVYLEGAKAGCDQLHLSIAPLANGAAQPANQTVIRNLRGMGFKVGTDDDAIDSISKHFAHIADVEGKPVGMPVEFDAFHYEHQIPGGMLSNFREQLATTGLSHKFGELLEECARVRRELAWPIMITPFAQFVGTQAVLNVIHGERYRHVPNEVKKYVLGYYGKLLGPVDPDVFDRIVENGSKDIPLKPSIPDPLVRKMRNRYPTVDDEELLLRMMFAGGQVDQMLKDKGQANPSIVNASVIDLIRTLAKAEKPGRIAISRSEFSLAMSKK